MPNKRTRFRRRATYVIPVCCALVVSGCGTTRWTNTPRTATEQLLLSDAIDRSINGFDLSALIGKEVFFDAQYLQGVVDEKYVVSSIRQHLLASGCILREKREDAAYVVEARAGVVGTDQQSLLLGVPSVSVPTFVPGVAAGAVVPEIPLAKKTDQKGVAKISLFAYNRETGRAVWQSGASAVVSSAKDTWLFGAGPYQRGSIYDRPRFAGDKISFIEEDHERSRKLRSPTVKLGSEARFSDYSNAPNADDEKLAAEPTAAAH